jgi:hypothetical protein
METGSWLENLIRSGASSVVFEELLEDEEEGIGEPRGVGEENEDGNEDIGEEELGATMGNLRGGSDQREDPDEDNDDDEEESDIKSNLLPIMSTGIGGLVASSR